MDPSLFLDREEDINYFKGNLPHWDQPDKLQFLTLHLGDSLPRHVCEDFKRRKEIWLSQHPSPWDETTRKEYVKEFYGKYNNLLDQGYGSCVLKDTAVCQMLHSLFDAYDNQSWNVWAFVIMPNHIHFLIQVINNAQLKKSINSFKNASSHRLCKIIPEYPTPVWHGEYFDTIIRNELHFRNVIKYLWKNVYQGAIGYRILNQPYRGL